MPGFLFVTARPTRFQLFTNIANMTDWNMTNGTSRDMGDGDQRTTTVYRSPKLSKPQYAMLLELTHGTARKYINFTRHRMHEEYVYDFDAEGNITSTAKLSTRSLPALIEKGFVEVKEVERQNPAYKYTIAVATEKGRRHLSDANQAGEPAYKEALAERSAHDTKNAWHLARGPLDADMRKVRDRIAALEREMREAIFKVDFDMTHESLTPIADGLRSLWKQRRNIQAKLETLYARFYPPTDGS